MKARGSAHPAIVLASSLIGVAVAAGGAAALQVQSAPATVGDIIQGGFSAVILLGVVWVLRRQDAQERNAREAELARDKRAEAQQKQDSDARRAIYNRIDQVMQDVQVKALANAETWGRLNERSEEMARKLTAQDLKIESVGSKIVNNLELRLHERESITDLQFQTLDQRLAELKTDLKNGRE